MSILTRTACFFSLALAIAAPAGCEPLRDVPARHWARVAATETVRLGILDAPAGRFRGDEKVTREGLAVAMARLGRALENGASVRAVAAALRPPVKGAKWENKPVTRYDLAAAIWRTVSYVRQAVNGPLKKRYGNSEAIPPRGKPAGIARTNPAYRSLVYLADRRMLGTASVLRKQDRSVVTAVQLSDCLSDAVVGLIDLYIDEPQNREDLGDSPPARR